MTREEEIKKASIEANSGIAIRPGTRILIECCTLSFQKGAKWADKHPKSPWISVKKDLPCNHKELIIDSELLDKHTKPVVCNKSYGVCVGLMVYNVDRNAWHWLGEKPTHWFPIPKLPKE